MQKSYLTFSMYTREQAINSILEKDPTCPQEILDALVLVNVNFFCFDGETHDGQIVVHQDLQQDITELFEFMLQQKFPLQEVAPIVKYDWNDEASMAANNSSAFNYRLVINTDRVSWHGYGRAIDINPKINPVVVPEEGKWGITQPANGSYNIEEPGTLYAGHEVVEFMKARGWYWYGDWEEYKDYQHFQKV
mgnify:FL=1